MNLKDVPNILRKNNFGDFKQQTELCMYDARFNRRLERSELDQAGDWSKVRTEQSRPNPTSGGKIQNTLSSLYFSEEWTVPRIKHISYNSLLRRST